MTLLYLAIAWACGVWLASQQPNIGVYWGVIALPGLLAVLLMRKSPIPRLIGLCAISLSLGAWRYESARPQYNAEFLATYNDRGGAELIGVVESPPEVRDQNIRLRVAVERIRLFGESSRAVQGVALVYAQEAGLRYGDRLRIIGTPQTPPEFDTFSWRDYLARSGIYTIVLNARITRMESAQGSPLLATLYSARDEARALLNRLLPDPSAALLRGILLGEDEGLSPDIADAFRRTNTTHLIAISGANISVVIALLLGLLGRLTGTWPSVWLTIVGITLYTIFVGASSSVVRAAIMGSLALVADKLGRRADGLTALAISAWAMTLINPDAIGDLGLILSVAATLGLVLYLKPLQKAVESFLSRLFAASTARQITGILADTTLITIVAQVTTLPIILLISSELSPLSLPINMLVAPAQPWIMTLGLAALLVGLAFPILGQLIAWFAALPTLYTLDVIRLGAVVETFPISVDVRAVVVYYALLFGLTAFWTQPKVNRARLVAQFQIPTTAILLSGVATAVLIWSVIFSLPDGRLHIWFLDVGRNGGVLMRTPHGAYILVDGGENPTRLLTAIGDRLPWFQRDIHLLIITNIKPTVTKALPRLAERYTIHRVLSSGLNSPPVQALAARGLHTEVVWEGYRVQTEDGVQIAVLAPSQPPAPGAKPDDVALLVQVRYGDAVLLLSSEWSNAAVEKIQRDVPSLGASVLLLPSHGSEAANPLEWLSRVNPQIGVIFTAQGVRNPAPSSAVLQHLKGLLLYRTDQHGTIHMRTDGREFEITTERPGR